LKSYEKESIIKGFVLFFSTLLILNITIFYLYFSEKRGALHVEIFNQIKLYNYDFKDKDMLLDIVPRKKASMLYKLFIKKNEIYAYFDIPTSKKNILKIIYPYNKYKKELKNIKKEVVIYFFISTFILFILSILYAFYTIKPIKEALSIMEMFLKDIIHDLNTPISSILLNLQILKKKNSQEAIKRIEFSAKNIGSLYNNLESIIKEEDLNIEEINISDLIKEKIEYYSYLYPQIKFIFETKIQTIHSSYNELSRILDNLISNACKYNKPNGKVWLHVTKEKIIIKDSGIGIKNIKKVFERFYKESDRGLGLGLNIVKKLCDKLGYKIDIQSKLNLGTTIEVTLR
jgi:two-component system OmpR family sensor kinase